VQQQPSQPPLLLPPPPLLLPLPIQPCALLLQQLRSPLLLLLPPLLLPLPQSLLQIALCRGSPLLHRCLPRCCHFLQTQQQLPQPPLP
jgi:hypothetical protein